LSDEKKNIGDESQKYMFPSLLSNTNMMPIVPLPQIYDKTGARFFPILPPMPDFAGQSSHTNAMQTNYVSNVNINNVVPNTIQSRDIGGKFNQIDKNLRELSTIDTSTGSKFTSQVQKNGE